MSDLISRADATDAALTFLVEYCGAAFDEDMQTMLCDRIKDLPSAEAVTVSWIEERIENAITADQTLIAQMWQELIDGYRREQRKKSV